MPIINLNFGYFVEMGYLPLPQMLLQLVLAGAWIIILVVVFYGVWAVYMDWRQVLYSKTLTFVVLAINVPHLNEQTPKAVEQIFAGLFGAYLFRDDIEIYWKGHIQPTISLELVSIGGHVQFLIRCRTQNRDLVEACIYSQYPDAEITEVEDYAKKITLPMPNATTKAFGIEWTLARPDYLPIKTYLQFEHNLSEEYFKDPMSQILEIFSSLRQGEQLWFQILITPTDGSWRKQHLVEADKIAGKKPVAKKKTALEHLADIPTMAVSEMASVMVPTVGGAKKETKKDDAAQWKMMMLTPLEKEILEAVQNKSSKIGFKSKIRMVYFGDPAVYAKGKIMGAMNGCLAQFTGQHLNGIRGYSKNMPKGNYFWQKWSLVEKTTRIIRQYQKRTNDGGPTFILNIEELATLWHFPYVHVKAPMVAKTEAKRGEAPMGLPIEGGAPGNIFTRVSKKAAAPPPLPTVEEPVDEEEEFLRNLPS